MESCHSLSFLWKKFVWKHCGVIFDSHSISYKAPWFSLCIVSIAEVDTSLLWLSEAAHRGQSAVQNTLQSVDAHALEKKSDGTSMLVAVLRCWSCCGKTPVSSLVLVAMETFVLPMVVGLRNGFFFFNPTVSFLFWHVAMSNCKWRLQTNEGGIRPSGSVTFHAGVLLRLLPTPVSCPVLIVSLCRPPDGGVRF